MEHLKNLINGARHVLVLDTGRSYIRPSRRDYRKDAEMLRKDARQVAGQLSENTEAAARKYG